MKKIKLNLILLIALVPLLTFCGGVRDALEGKKRSEQSDEFLVKKKNPLQMPPDMNKLPMPGDDLEIFQRDVAIDNFDLKNVLPNPAIFDTVKLIWMNGQYIRNLNKDEFSKKATDNISTSLGREIFQEELERINIILPVVQERLETLNDITDQIKFLLDEPFTVNTEEWNDANSKNVQNYLKNIRENFKLMEKFNLENIESMMREELNELNMKPKEGFQATRIAVTGTKISPPLFESIFALGKSATIARLAEMIENL